MPDQRSGELSSSWQQYITPSKMAVLAIDSEELQHWVPLQA